MMDHSVSELEAVKSACELCVACCGIVLHVEDGKMEPGSDGALALISHVKVFPPETV